MKARVNTEQNNRVLEHESYLYLQNKIYILKRYTCILFSTTVFFFHGKNTPGPLTYTLNKVVKVNKVEFEYQCKYSQYTRNNFFYKIEQNKNLFLVCPAVIQIGTFLWSFDPRKVLVSFWELSVIRRRMRQRIFRMRRKKLSVFAEYGKREWCKFSKISIIRAVTENREWNCAYSQNTENGTKRIRPLGRMKLSSYILETALDHV